MRQSSDRFTGMPLFFQLLQSHASADRMVALLSIYEEEDEAYHSLVTVATTFFQYLLQPFRDMRELACLYKMEILVSAKLCTRMHAGSTKWKWTNNRKITSLFCIDCGVILKLFILLQCLELSNIKLKFLS